MLLEISKEEFIERQNNFINKLSEKNIEAAVVFSPIDIFYLTGFHFTPTERPIALILDPKHQFHMFVPDLEYDHAVENAAVFDHIKTYPEYPGIKHPMLHLKDNLIEFGFTNKVIGLDAAGYGSSMGYEGPRVADLIDAKEIVMISKVVQRLREIKSDAEIELIKESCRWANLAHKLLQTYTKVGKNEIDIVNRVRSEAGSAMVNTLGEGYKPYGSPAFAYYRGQIGKMSAFPHINRPNTVFKKGDTLITAAGAEVFGYGSELERVMFVKEVSKEQEKFFHLVTEAHKVAVSHIKPGNPVSTVDQAVRDYFEGEGVFQYALHHVGHAIGINHHEAPFFDIGDQTIMEPGMVFTVEPGLYVKELGGFRHSDTLLVTEDGVEYLTYYTMDLDSLICY